MGHDSAVQKMHGLDFFSLGMNLEVQKITFCLSLYLAEEILLDIEPILLILILCFWKIHGETYWAQ